MPPFFDILLEEKGTDIFNIPEQKEDKPVYESISDSVESGPSVEDGYEKGPGIEEGPSVEEGGFEAEKRPVYVSVEDYIRTQGTRTVEGAGSSIDSRIFKEGVSAFPAYGDEIDMNVISAGEIVSEEEAARAAEDARLAMASSDWTQAIIYSEILKRKEF